MIPKKIHYCWLSNDPIPEELQHYMDTWEKKLPEYEFKKWSFECFDINYSDWVKEAFENKKYAFAADYIRLYALYKEGGIYLDMDIEVLKNFEDLLNKPLMLAYENENQNSFEAGVLGAEKENSYIKACLDYYNDRHFVREDGSFDMLTLPKIMFEEIMKKGYKEDVYPSVYFTAKSFSTGKIYANEKTYSIHHFAGSWLSNAEQKWNNFERGIRKTFGEKTGYYILKYSPLRVIGFFMKWGIKGGFRRIIKKYISK